MRIIEISNNKIIFSNNNYSQDIYKCFYLKTTDNLNQKVNKIIIDNIKPNINKNEIFHTNLIEYINHNIILTKNNDNDEDDKDNNNILVRIVNNIIYYNLISYEFKNELIYEKLKIIIIKINQCLNVKKL